MAFGLPAALTAVIALSIVPLLRRPMTADLLVDEIVSGHVRSLMADHLTDVASSDKHTVKPWFDGKVDFSPAVVDLADHGFPLVGGRLEYLGNRSVAALVYARQKHFINLFVWPSSHEERPDALKSPQHGFNVIHWDGSEMTYWAVSDLNPAELGEFAELLKQRTETVTGPANRQQPERPRKFVSDPAILTSRAFRVAGTNTAALGLSVNVQHRHRGNHLRNQAANG